MVSTGTIHVYGIIVAMDTTRLRACFITINTYKSITILDHMIRSHETLKYLYHSVYSEMNHFHKLERGNYNNRKYSCAIII